jgi:glycine C-acetyltransferase
MVSAIDSLVDRHDVIVYDSEAHACIIDGLRMHMGKRFVYPHNDLANLEKQLQRATSLVKDTPGGILVITEGVFGMSGDQGKLKEIVALKNAYNFRLFVDDAHGFGTMGPSGAGTAEAQGVQDGVDIYFGTFAKSMALIGGFISADRNIVEFLRYNMRSQIFAKALPMPLVVGALKRLELLRTMPILRQKLWEIVNALQKGLVEAGFSIGNTESPVTPVYLNGTIPEATHLIKDLRENFDIFCSMVVYPVVPKGIIMLRLIPTAIHTLEDVSYTISAFRTIKDNLASGKYAEEKIANFNA